LPTQTVSTISGVTGYATEALAKAGAVDSGAAFNTWMRAQSSSSASQITLIWDCWIFVADMANDYLQLTPTGSGWITHVPASTIKGVITGAAVLTQGSGYTGTPTVAYPAPAGGGTTAAGAVTTASNVVTYLPMTNVGAGYTQADNPVVGMISGGSGSGATAQASIGGNCGVVWAVKSTASPCCALGNKTNGDWVTSPSAIVISNVSFARNANGVGVTLDFGYPTGGSQPHDSSTWGWAVGLSIWGVSNLSIDGLTRLNSRTFSVWGVNWLNVSVTNSTIDNGIHSSYNYDGEHWNGPGDGFFYDGSVNGGFGYCHSYSDDAFTISPSEPVGNTPNFPPPWGAGWKGGNITNVKILNVTLSDVLNGFRFQSCFPIYTGSKYIVDGVKGTCTESIWRFDNGNLQAGSPYPIPQTFDSVIIRNIDVNVTTDTFTESETGRCQFNSTILLSTYFQSVIDLTTHVVNDVSTTKPLLMITGNSFLNPVQWGPIYQQNVDDWFQGAFAAGWTQGLVPFEIETVGSTSLAEPSNVAAAMTRQGAGEIAENMYVRDSVYFSGGLTMTAHRADYTNNTGTEHGYQIYISNSSSPVLVILRLPSTTLLSQAVALTDAESYLLETCAIGPLLFAQLTNISTNSVEFGIALTDPSPYETAGWVGKFDYPNSGTPANLQHQEVSTSTILAYSTLTSITITNTGVDALGRVLFAAAPNTNAYCGNGVWSLTSPPAGVSIDQFGRVSGLSSGGITVVYTLGAVSGSTTYSALTILALSVATSGGNAVLTWTADPLATSYNVLRASVIGSPYTRIANPSAGTLTYTDTAPLGGTSYYAVTSNH